MSSLAKMRLSKEWYPHEEILCLNTIKEFISSSKSQRNSSFSACLVPHAAWIFCGKIIANTLFTLYNNSKSNDIKRVVLLGGHLLQNDPILYFGGDSFQTPLGNITQDNNTISNIINDINKFYHCQKATQDNSIETILPFIKFFFPNTQIITFSIPPILNKLKDIAASILMHINQKETLFIASSDLTHYGPAYQLTHENHSSIEQNLSWAKHNDLKLINFILNRDYIKTIKHATQNKAACSSGAISTALIISSLINTFNKPPCLIDYYSSFDIRPYENFVGYAGIAF